MTTHTSTGRLDNLDDDTFRDWVSRAIAMLTAVGLVRTEDTGQIDTETVVRPTAINTVAGYAIFRFDDDAQGEAPIFLRVNFGSGINLPFPGMHVVVCKGTDGAGTPIDVLYTGTMPVQGRVLVETVWRASGGPGYVALCPAAAPQGTYANGGGLAFFLVERSPDGSSVLIVEQQPGTTALQTSSGMTPRVTVVTYDSNAATSGAPPVALPYTIAGAVLTSGTPLAAASLGPVFPWVLFPPAQTPWQSRLAISYPGGDAPGSAFQVTLEGEERTYLPIPLSDAYCAFGLGLDASAKISRHVGLAIRWE